ncbi:MAG: LapA family protein, partial [Mycobacteriaceae bacterium]
PLGVTRTASAWTGLVVGALILILLLVFVLQNNENTKLSILVWDFTLPLGVSMLFAAIAGALIMALAGGARILQLRKAYKNHRR